MDEETSELRTEWERHPYTIQYAKSYESQKDLAFKNLMAECSRSSDAAVRALHAKYVEMAVVATWMKTGGGKKK
jgi:hypothetical protein